MQGGISHAGFVLFLKSCSCILLPNRDNPCPTIIVQMTQAGVCYPKTDGLIAPRSASRALNLNLAGCRAVLSFSDCPLYPTVAIGEPIE